MIEVLRYENGEITFNCECKTQLFLYCREDNTGIAICENCGRKYTGSSYITVALLPERDIEVLKKKVNKLKSELVNATARKGQIEDQIIQLDSTLRKARGLLISSLSKF